MAVPTGTRIAAAFALIGAVVSQSAAQSPLDSINTPRGRCGVWVPIPGGSNRSDLTYNRCALERGPTLLPGQRWPAAPRANLSAQGQLTIVVNPDGTVDSRLTRDWIRTSDSAFNDIVLATVREWRFEPGVRAGRPVRSGLMLHVQSDVRVDTVPAHLEWQYRQGLNSDSLIGRWVRDPVLPSFTAEQIDSVHAAVLRRLVATRIVQHNVMRARCLLPESADSSAFERLKWIGYRIIDNNSDVMFPAPRGCERDASYLRIVFKRVHHTENSRVVVLLSGDQLRDWPFGFDGKNYRSWNARCVGEVPRAGSAAIDCEVMPDFMIEFPEIPAVRDSSAPDTVLTIITFTRGAYQKDTMRVKLAAVPTLERNAIVDSNPRCTTMSWAAFATQDSAELYIVKADFSATAYGNHFQITRAATQRSPEQFNGGSCRPPAAGSVELATFILGDIGDPIRGPVTLCIGASGCPARYVLDPARHTLARAASVRFRLSDLRPETRAGDQLVFRIYANRRIPELTPLVVVKTGNRWSAFLARRIDERTWEYGVTFGDGYPPDTEVRVYAIARR